MYSYENYPEDDTLLAGMKTLNNNDSDIESCYLPDIEYADYNGIKRTLQLLIPNKREYHNEKYPLILFIQGSAWEKQDIYKRVPTMGYISQKGFVTAIVQYRESEIAPFPAQVQDAKAAIRFLRKNAGKYRIQTENVFIWGDSSGGHTALLAGLTGNTGKLDTPLHPAYSSHVNGIIDFYGVVDIRMEDGFPNTENHQQPDSPEGKLLGQTSILDHPELAAQTVPMEYLDGPIPPVLIMHGTKDRTVAFQHSVKLYQALTKAHKEVEFYRLRNADHGSPSFYRGSTLAIVIDFIKRHLRDNA